MFLTLSVMMASNLIIRKHIFKKNHSLPIGQQDRIRNGTLWALCCPGFGVWSTFHQVYSTRYDLLPGIFHRLFRRRSALSRFHLQSQAPVRESSFTLPKRQPFGRAFPAANVTVTTTVYAS